MIDIQLYRCRVGIFSGGGVRGNGKSLNQDFSVFSPYCNESTKFYCFDQNTGYVNENIVHCQKHFIRKTLSILFYSYLISIFVLVSSLMVLSANFPNYSVFQSVNFVHGLPIYISWSMSHISVTHIKVAYFYFIFYAIPRAFFRSRHGFSICYPINCSRATRIITNLILSILVLNFLLIGIVNPSLLNPGPNELKVYYQNVQGLLPFKELDRVQPKLIETKIFEINSYVNKYKPHVIMLNETWLKKTIGNRAVIEDPCYEVFRLDRSKVSHPPDPDNPRHGVQKIKCT